MMPDENEAVLIMERVGANRKVIEHCKAVEFFASRIAERLKENGVTVDIDLVKIGALLHDIGRSKTHGIEHGIVGAHLARELGFDDALIKIIERHIGAGILKKDAKGLGLPQKNYIPETMEEKIVAHADNMVLFKKHPIERTLEKLEKKGKPQLAERIRRLHEELSELAGMDLNEL